MTRSCRRRLRPVARMVPLALAVAMAVLGSTGTAGAQSDTPAVPTVPLGATAVEGCVLAFGRDAFGSAPSEGLVAPGDPLSLDVTWGTGWKPGQTLDVLSCTAVNGVFSEELSVRRRAPEPDGLLSHDVRVPGDATAGATVCQRAIIIGESSAGAPRAERLDPSCFTVAPTAATTTEAAPAAPSGGQTTKPTRGASAPGGPRPAPQAATPAPTSEALPTGLARTGTTERILALAAGVLFVIGGWGVAVGRPGRLPAR